MVSPFMPDEEKLAAVREGLPATGAGIYLNTGTAGPIPRETAAAMAELAQWELATGRAHMGFIEEASARMDEARAAVAAILHADLDAIAITHSTTDGVNAALWSIDWTPGDVLVTTTLEFLGVDAAIHSLERRRGVVVRRVTTGPDDTATLEAFGRAIDPRTRMVVLSHVAWSTGEMLPVGGVVAVARAAASRPLVVLDGAQSVGAIPIDVDALGIDFLALPAHKWLLGPEGMGALYVSGASLGRVRPAFAGVRSLLGAGAAAAQNPSAAPDTPDTPGPSDPSTSSTRLRADARAFEWSNFHAPSVLGMARSCGWLSMYVGLDWISDRGRAHARRAFDLLAATPGVSMVTPADRLATLVVFRIAGWAAADALDELGRRTFVIARHIQPLNAIRISTGFFNTEAEIGRFCEAVAEIAAHTPQNLPRRPALTMLGER